MCSPDAAELWTRVRQLLKPSPDVVHYILTHFRWLWDIVNYTFLRDVLMRLVLTGHHNTQTDVPQVSTRLIHQTHISVFLFLFFHVRAVRSNLIPSPPTFNSKYGYLSWESYYNLSYYTRILPPVPDDCPTPVGVKGEQHIRYY